MQLPSQGTEKHCCDQYSTIVCIELTEPFETATNLLILPTGQPKAVLNFIAV